MEQSSNSPISSSDVEYSTFSVLDKFEAFEILLRPARLLDHALQRFSLEGAVAAVKGHRDAAAVGVVKNLVRSVPAIITKSVTD